jgi:hypothetical protein
MARIHVRWRLLLATVTATALAMTLGLTTPTMSYAAENVSTTDRFISEEGSSRKCQCGW